MRNFFVLAGGYGKRAKPLSDFKPKAAFPVDQTPLIGLILSQLYRSGFRKGFINVHHLPLLIKASVRTGIKINFVSEKTLSGNMVLKSVLEDIEEYLMVVNGDVFLEIPVAELYHKMLHDKPDGVILIKQKSVPEYSTIIFDNDNYIKREKDNNKDGYFFTGVALLNRKVIKSINAFNLFDVLAKQNFDIRVVKYNGIWCEFGFPQMYLNSVFSIKKHLGDFSHNSLAKNVEISKDSRIDNCVIWENCIINNCWIKNCIISGNISLNSCRYQNKIITSKGIIPI